MRDRPEIVARTRDAHRRKRRALSSLIRSLSPQEIESELETLLRGEAWVDWNDNRHT